MCERKLPLFNQKNAQISIFLQGHNSDLRFFFPFSRNHCITLLFQGYKVRCNKEVGIVMFAFHIKRRTFNFFHIQTNFHHIEFPSCVELVFIFGMKKMDYEVNSFSIIECELNHQKSDMAYQYVREPLRSEETDPLLDQPDLFIKKTGNTWERPGPLH